MSFEDLPADWNRLPLTDPLLARGVVDLFLKDSDRVQDSLLFLLCDDELRALQPVVINDVPWHCPAKLRRQMLGVLRSVSAPAVVVAVSSAHPMRADRIERWRRDVAVACAAGGPVLLHFFSATPFDVVAHTTVPPRIAS